MLDSIKFRLSDDITPVHSASEIEHLINRHHSDQNDYQIVVLASVMERKSEIGLLRAIGARQSDVVRQFLIETSAAVRLIASDIKKASPLPGWPGIGSSP